MPISWPRRHLLRISTFALPLMASLRGQNLFGAKLPGDPSSSHQPVSDLFPTQPPELAREMVTVAHFDLNRVKELVEAHPSLARAAWDWGFGDWESALGGASHMGNRAIAEYLISKGARPSLFSAAMLGQLEVVKAFVTAQPDVLRIRGPHSISLLAHAKAGGERARPVFEYLQTLGGADAQPQVPLSEKEAAAYTGTYNFGIGASQQIEVTVERGQVIWARKGAMGRPLFHLGKREFHPLGAEAVRIRFEETAGEMVMTMKDADWELTAQRKMKK
jgi:hypothetical protein